MIGRLLWQPFEVRFSNFLKKLDFHQRGLDQEMYILECENTLAIAVRQDEQSQQTADAARVLTEQRKLLDDIQTQLDQFLDIIVQRVTADQDGRSTCPSSSSLIQS